MITSARTFGCRAKAGSARLLRRLCKNQRGSIGIIAAVTLPALLGFGGLAVDASLWARAKNSVQGAADEAASSAAAAAAGGNSWSRISYEAMGVAAANGYQNGVYRPECPISSPACSAVSVTPINPPTPPSAYAGNAYAYEVTIRAPQQLYLASVVSALYGLVTPPTVVGRAVALTTTSPTCILALNPNNVTSGTLTTSGGATLTATNCDVSNDSISAKSISTSGGGSITATNVKTVGDVNGNVTATSGSVQTGTGPIPDPYAGKRSIPPIPPYELSSANNWNGRVTNPTGVKAFNGNVSVTGQGAQLDPGVYIINGDFSSSKPLSGTGGVTIVVTGAAGSDHTFSIGGSATLTLTAPTTGTTAGIAIWINPTCTTLPCNSNNLTGNTTPNITGAIYAPGGQVKFAGSSQSASTGCTQVIAYQIVVTGNPVFHHDCAGVSVLDPISKWALVE